MTTMMGKIRWNYLENALVDKYFSSLLSTNNHTCFLATTTTNYDNYAAYQPENGCQIHHLIGFSHTATMRQLGRSLVFFTSSKCGLVDCHHVEIPQPDPDISCWKIGTRMSSLSHKEVRFEVPGRGVYFSTSSFFKSQQWVLHSNFNVIVSPKSTPKLALMWYRKRCFPPKKC